MVVKPFEPCVVALSVQFPPFALWMICTVSPLYPVDDLYSSPHLALWLIAFCNNKFFEVVVVSHTLQIHETNGISSTETKRTSGIVNLWLGSTYFWPFSYSPVHKRYNLIQAHP